MKKFFGILVVMLALTASAFTVPHKNATVAGNEYSYNLYGQPGQDNPSNLNNPANYTLVNPLSCPIPGSHRCGVSNATDDGTGHPDFTKSYTIRLRN
ncbi:MAG: hypothetical protein J0H85_03090 [Sediminibacterium magnilacihabitans]|jgi:hypothetical protein|nr:hypothetical protein [Sediminibacterium magnilacihabitans]PQV62131.1 hypothetical protein CLV53_101406 [Sediminibacterium magnilacihabitans]